MTTFSSGSENFRFLISAPTFGHWLDVAGAGVGVDRGAAEVGPEDIVAALEIFDLELGVHRVRLPAEEDDRLLAPRRALDLGQHALLARLDDLEFLQAELVRLDHVDDQAVAVVARLDAVDLAGELALELRDVGESS